jgi:Lar family restriction alleviation protein
MKLSDIEEAFLFVGSAAYGENTAILDTSTGKTYYQSIYGDGDDQLPDEDFDSTIHLRIPHKNELDLGTTLVFEFVERYMPDDDHTVQNFFRKRGAYARFKDFLASRELLDQWYNFENQRIKAALLSWCHAHGVRLDDSPLEQQVVEHQEFRNMAGGGGHHGITSQTSPQGEDELEEIGFLPCPFCGSMQIDIMEGDDEEGETAYWVICQECNAGGPEGETVKEAQRVWNGRSA